DNEAELILMEVADEKITKAEFLKVYFKNSKKDKEIDQKSLEEYIELYSNFKLKVAEARELGLDTTSAFKNELSGYRKQLAQPYLNDKEISEKLLIEAYERKKHDVRASHILIKVGMDAEPKDTLLAYNKIIKLRKRILDGADFNAIARQVSEDPSAKDNGGDLGYFTVFQMIYPFETMAYTTKVGGVSKPVRTRYGYHIIKVADKKDALLEVKTSHIMVIASRDVSQEAELKAKQKIDLAYQNLKDGATFKEAALKFSEDKKTAKTGGALPWFSTGKMVGDFEKAIAGLDQIGDYSTPVRTDYGWHIIQLNEQKPLPEFNDVKSTLKVKISKDARSNKPREVFVNKVKKEYNFKQDLKKRNEFYKYIDEQYYSGRWKAEKVSALNSTMFTLGAKEFNQQDFARYIKKNPSRKKKQKDIAPKTVVNSLYLKFVQESCIDYEDSHLESKYPDFKSLVQEYRDGILLFELTDKKVWSKAIKDTAGLKIFYNSNRNKYMWDQRLDAEIYTCSDEITAAKTRKLVKKKAKKGYTLEYIKKTINAEKNVLAIAEGKYLKDAVEINEKVQWTEGISENINEDSEIVFVNVKKVLPVMPKALSEAKGLITADYQVYLEKEWIELLRKKYPLIIHKDVLSTIK
ncbi:MAG TPA: peptidylprolyl isomerase, partial [Flavobacteriales bacterium]|nr:peptidylprolyl isomerase [Flavobacteriales bacterium]